MNLYDRPLFVFGTLMDPDVLQLVCDVAMSELSFQPAVLNGFQRRLVKGEAFPVLVPAHDSGASGLLVRGLSAAAVQRAQFFEGEEYELQPIQVEGLPDSHTHTLASGSIPAAYFADQHVYNTENEDWDFKRWQQFDKPEFITRLSHYMTFFGTLSAAEADAHW